MLEKKQEIETCAMRRHLNLIDGGNAVTTVLMRVGPSGPVFRSRSQTTASGIGQESLWWTWVNRRWGIESLYNEIESDGRFKRHDKSIRRTWLVRMRSPVYRRHEPNRRYCGTWEPVVVMLRENRVTEELEARKCTGFASFAGQTKNRRSGA